MQTHTELNQTQRPAQAEQRPTDRKASAQPGAAVEARVRYFAPAVDILENEGEVLIVADVPGVKPESFSIRLDKETLTFVGHRTPAQGAAEVGYKRSFVIPREIDVEHIEAELENGVLTLHLPRHASAKPRQIAIRAKQ